MKQVLSLLLILTLILPAFIACDMSVPDGETTEFTPSDPVGHTGVAEDGCLLYAVRGLSAGHKRAGDN